ncbi:MAG: alginate lyase family protein [Anaerolineae bacterium]
MNYRHFGLYFTSEHVDYCHQHAEQEPFITALSLLNNSSESAVSSSLAALVLGGFRYRFNGDMQSGEQAVLALQSGHSLEVSTYPTYFDALAGAVTLAQSVELVRDHPHWTVDTLNNWLMNYASLTDQLQPLPENAGIVEQLWLGLLNLVSGIVLESDQRFTVGVEAFQHAIQNEIRPEGYLPRAVEISDGYTLHRDLWCVMALVGMAEAASHVGVDLWSYESRGISVSTAAAYITYYYYYPDQWRWDAVTEELAKPLYKEQGAFLEMVNRSTHPRDLKLLLEEQRPFFTPALGGLTTLTHGKAKKERRGLFG